MNLLEPLLAIVVLYIVNAVEAQKDLERHPVKVAIQPTNGTYKGSVHFNDTIYNLHLQRPESSVFASNFTFHVSKQAPRGLHFEEFSFTPEEMQEREMRTYVDEEQNAVLKVTHEMGEIRLHGQMDNIHISHDGDSHFAVVHENNNDIRDYVEIDRPKSKPSNTMRIQGVTTAQPKLLIVLDNKQWTNLKMNQAAAMDYCSMLIHAVNLRYRTIPDLKIIFSIVGMLVMNARSDQPYIEQSKIDDGSDRYDIYAVLEKFHGFMYGQKDKVAKHDLSPLISGEKFKDFSGLAYIGGACSVTEKSSWKTSVTSDQGGVWRGMMTLVHELAHNLGAPHDGEEKTKSCPWSTGYIMSYEGWGNANKFKFSPCSCSLMKNFIDSNQGACLRSDPVNAWPEAKQYTGDRFNMDQQCQRLLGRSDTYCDKDRSADDSCKNLVCKYPGKCSPTDSRTCTWTQRTNSLPYDNSICGTSGGKCKDGTCTR